MKLSIIIPCYNEEKTIGELIDKIYNLDIQKQIIIIDDKSNDTSRSIIEQNKHKIDKIIYHEKNLVFLVLLLLEYVKLNHSTNPN